MDCAFHKQIAFASVAPKFDPAGAGERRAWVYLVMLVDDYAAGAAVSARSLRECGTAYPIWCMYAGVSAECVEFLRGQFDHIVEVSLLEHEHVRSPGVKRNTQYTSWTKYSFTKLHMLDPQILPFDKVMLLDADSFMVNSADHLFNLPAPAMTFSSPWTLPYTAVKKSGWEAMPNPYGEIPHGSGVTRGQVAAGLSNAIVGIASMVLIRPHADYVTVRDLLLAAPGKYGYSGCFSGPDEQMLAEILAITTAGPGGEPSADDVVAYHIHQIYNWNIGKVEWIPPRAKPLGVAQYYINTGESRPWRNLIGGGNSTYDDMRIWWYYAKMVINDSNIKLFYSGNKIVSAHLAGNTHPLAANHLTAVAALTSKVLTVDIVASAKRVVEAAGRRKIKW